MTPIEVHYRSNYKSYTKVALRFLKDHAYAEDAVQEAYAKAIKHQDKLGDVHDLNGWMYVIFQNTLRTMRQKILNNGVVMEVVPQKFPVDPFSGEKWSLHDLMEAIEKWVKNPIHKKILTMYTIKGYTAQEIEDLSGIPVTTTYVAWKRFKEKLKES